MVEGGLRFGSDALPPSDGLAPLRLPTRRALGLELAAIDAARQIAGGSLLPAPEYCAAPDG